MARSRKNAIPTQMKLPESTRELARIVGGGDRTGGVERLFAALPVFYQVVVYLSLQSEQGDDLAEALLVELQGLEIERVYGEAVCEGIIVPGANGEPAAWIV